MSRIEIVIEENGKIYLKEKDALTSVLTALQVCKKLKRTRRQIYRYIEAGIIKPIVKIQGEWLFYNIDIENMAKYGTALRRALPEDMRSLFPEYEFEKLRSDTDADLIITRILNCGSLKNIIWMLKKYNKETIKEIIKNGSVSTLSEKSLNYWSGLFKVKNTTLPKWRRKYDFTRSFV